MNKFIGIGHLTKEPDFKHINTGAAMYRNSVAINRNYKKQNGEKAQETLFLDFFVFGRPAEVLNQYTRKGSKVLLEGHLVLQEWQDQHGNKKQKIALAVENIELMDSKKDSEKQELQQYAQQQSNATQGQGLQHTLNNAPSYDIDSLANDDILSTFSVAKKGEGEVTLKFVGTQEQFEAVKGDWENTNKRLIEKHNLQNVKINYVKEIIENTNELPF